MASTSITLVAERIDTGARLAIGDTDLNLLRELSEAHLLRCVHCGGALVLKAGSVRLHHFAHVSHDGCDYPDRETETVSHRLGKSQLYQHFRAGAQAAALEYRIVQTDQRADCYIRGANGQPYALEFQQANNSADHWAMRRRLYHEAGLRDIWFLGQVRYKESVTEPPRPISPYEPLPIVRDRFEAAAGAFMVREMEKAMLADDSRLIYLDPDTAQLTILLLRVLSGNTLRAYRYRLPLADAELRDGVLWTPLDPLLTDYWRLRDRHRAS